MHLNFSINKPHFLPNSNNKTTSVAEDNPHTSTPLPHFISKEMELLNPYS